MGIIYKNSIKYGDTQSSGSLGIQETLLYEGDLSTGSAALTESILDFNYLLFIVYLNSYSSTINHIIRVKDYVLGENIRLGNHTQYLIIKFNDVKSVYSTNASSARLKKIYGIKFL